MGASVGGVGIMMGTNASDLITETRSVSHRILAVTFAENPKTTVVSMYAPTEGADYEEAEQFHWELREFIHSVPAHNFLIVLGDMNARLGWEGAASGWYYHRNTSRNGELLRSQHTVPEEKEPSLDIPLGWNTEKSHIGLSAF